MYQGIKTVSFEEAYTTSKIGVHFFTDGDTKEPRELLVEYTLLDGNAVVEQMWAEAMEIYRSGRFKLAFSSAMQRYLKEHQRDFMPEDTRAGMIQAYLGRK